MTELEQLDIHANPADCDSPYQQNIKLFSEMVGHLNLAIAAIEHLNLDILPRRLQTTFADPNMLGSKIALLNQRYQEKANNK
jgi:hypothetical protein